MTGNLLWNFWFAIFGFSLYFFMAFSNGAPTKVLWGSILTAASFFGLMYLIRMLLRIGMDEGAPKVGIVKGEILEEQITQEAVTAERTEYDDQEIAAVIQTFLKEE
ncbi:hypothetical protein [Rossellomorea aquimaris]|uniref:Uncharacterized protein n=1 Tax=Rossellomorea aquimaris TaxID=189382 RepID=A0A5D4U544_9BACI|nr:hypothetical protein [Rossellomorea aquimaris]TYS82445.1 hypothetical protein FZC80_06005 [Rossellomorea aquimaris]